MAAVDVDFRGCSSCSSYFHSVPFGIFSFSLFLFLVLPSGFLNEARFSPNKIDRLFTRVHCIKTVPGGKWTRKVELIFFWDGNTCSAYFFCLCQIKRVWVGSTSIQRLCFHHSFTAPHFLSGWITRKTFGRGKIFLLPEAAVFIGLRITPSFVNGTALQNRVFWNSVVLVPAPLVPGITSSLRSLLKSFLLLLFLIGEESMFVLVVICFFLSLRYRHHSLPCSSTRPCSFSSFG